MLVHDNEESEYKDGFSNNEGLGMDSGLADRSQDLSRNLPTEVGKGKDASYLRQSNWERRSRKWDIGPESWGINVDSGNSDNSTKAAL